MEIISAGAPGGDTNSEKERVEALATPQILSNPTCQNPISSSFICG